MKKTQNRRKIIGFWGMILILAVVVLTGSMRLNNEDHSDAVSVAVVNGEVVEAREFSAVLLAERSKVYAYFQDKYGAEDGPEFWKHNYNGEIPQAKIKTAALKKIVRLKVLQSLGMQYGLLQDASYTAFLEELRAENDRRKKEVENGRPVYGPKQVGEMAYYEMRQSNLLEALKSKMNGKLAASDLEIKAYYEENKHEFVKTEDEISGIIEFIALEDVRNGIAAKLNDQSFERFIQEEVSLAQLVLKDEALQAIQDQVLQNH